jgi:hypothetical protein
VKTKHKKTSHATHSSCWMVLMKLEARCDLPTIGLILIPTGGHGTNDAKEEYEQILLTNWNAKFLATT